MGTILALAIAGAGIAGYYMLKSPSQNRAVKMAAGSKMPAIPTPTAAATAPEVVVPKTPPAEVKNTPVTAEKPPEPSPAVAGPLPTLQGIVYVPGSASAILNGRTVHRGEKIGNFLVKEIGPTSVTLVGPDNKPVQLNI